MARIESRSNLRLEPADTEIHRRLAEELDFTRRLCRFLINEESIHIPIQFIEDYEQMLNASDSRIESMIDTLVGGSDKHNEMEREGLSGAEGESKSNLWRRLREKVLELLNNIRNKSPLFDAIADYMSFGKTMVESIQQALGEGNVGLALSEMYGYMESIFQSMAKLESDSQPSW